MRMYKYEPSKANALCDLGITLFRAGDMHEAEGCFRKSLGIDPNNFVAYYYLGDVLMEQLRLNEALKSYDRAIGLNPNFAEARFNRALLLLLRGNFGEGFKEYEWRLARRNNPRRIFDVPKWKGEKLKNKKIFVYAEQGFGDVIQFIRYLHLLKARDGYVMFECQRGLIPLFENFAGADEIIEQGRNRNTISNCDFYVPLMSLPGIFKTDLSTIPAKVPYIDVSERAIKQWQDKMGRNGFFKVGIVWSGNPSHIHDRTRSCFLDDFSPLFEIPGVSFYSLQKGMAARQLSKRDKRIKNIAKNFRNFADTAAAVQNLDLIISVDTSVAHLAGALGKPAWTVLSYRCDPRWLLKRMDSPWYPTMRLFRQKKYMVWSDVFSKLRDELQLIVPRMI